MGRRAEPRASSWRASDSKRTRDRTPARSSAAVCDARAACTGAAVRRATAAGRAAVVSAADFVRFVRALFPAVTAPGLVDVGATVGADERIGADILTSCLTVQKAAARRLLLQVVTRGA